MVLGLSPFFLFWHMILLFLFDGLDQVFLTRLLSFSLCSGWISLIVITALKDRTDLSGLKDHLSLVDLKICLHEGSCVFFLLSNQGLLVVLVSFSE